MDDGTDMYDDVDVCNNLFDAANNNAADAIDSGDNNNNNNNVDTVIDAIAEGRARSTRNGGGGENDDSNIINNYRYFDEKNIMESQASAVAGNNWAGAQHWKRGKKVVKEAKKDTETGAKATKKR